MQKVEPHGQCREWQHGQLGLSLTSRHQFFWYIFYVSTWFNVRGRILVSTRLMCYKLIHTQCLRWSWMGHIFSPTHCTIKIRPLSGSPGQGVMSPITPEYQYPWFQFHRAFKFTRWQRHPQNHRCCPACHLPLMRRLLIFPWHQETDWLLWLQHQR